jgi:hypothetical protein
MVLVPPTGPRFHIDDHVYLLAQNMMSRQQTSERFVVIAVMPQDRSGSYQYRIRPTSVGPQRVANELELRR